MKLAISAGRLLTMGLVVLLVSCSERVPASEFARKPSHAIYPPPDTPLSRVFAPGEHAKPGFSGFQLVQTGTEAFLLRMAMVRAAEKTLDLQYYIAHEDDTGQLLLNALVAAADRGVRVRILLDEWNLDDFRKIHAILNAHPNIEVRVFNPVATRDQPFWARVGNLIVHTDRFTRRMHNKMMIADNKAAIAGGRNLGNEYFDASKEFNFRDMDVLGVGPIAVRLSRSFDEYWNSEQAYPSVALKKPESDPDKIIEFRKELQDQWNEFSRTEKGKPVEEANLLAMQKAGKLHFTWAKAELASDDPDKVEDEEIESRPARRLEQLVERAHHEFIAVTPYLVPLDEGVEWMRRIVESGVAVRILTNSLSSTDVVPVHSGYSKYRSDLVSAGVELHEYKPRDGAPQGKGLLKGSSSKAALHTKLYIIDRRELVIGSFNLDPRSALNTELIIVIHSPDLAAQAYDLFEKAIQPTSSYELRQADGRLVWVTEEGGAEKTYDSDPQAGLWRSFLSGLFYLLPLDEKL